MSFTVKNNSVIMGVTEFRNNLASLLNGKNKDEIIVVNRDKPLGVLMDFDKYKNEQDLLEVAEDLVLADMAFESRKTKGEALTQKQMEAKHGL